MSVAWMAWGDAAFERARREDKPILLSISAVWCHWCHVMDGTTYADERIAATINANYVPIRVDNDERPDVNARYNMGGWPTTAFLTPDGSTLTGATYLPPAAMQRALDDIARFYVDERESIAQRANELRAARQTYASHSVDDVPPEAIDAFAASLAENYDEEFAGFGDAPKFPQPDMLDFLLLHWRATQRTLYYDMVSHTLRAMASGGMYDPVEGGFFRYSTTRDWSVPHFEKMAEDHAGLIRVLAQVQLWAPSDETRATLTSALGYVRTVFRDAATGFFAGSQDADEAYYALPLDERRRRTAPFVDRRSYSNWTAGLAGAFAWASVALDDTSLADEALATLDGLHDRMRDDDGLLVHVYDPKDGTRRVRGLLADQSAYLRALLDAHEATGEARLLERARAFVPALRERFEASDGGFHDHARIEGAIGRLDLPDRPIGDNGTIAESLLRLETMTGDAAYRAPAEAALALYAQTYARAGSFAATYVRALARLLAPPVSVRLEGDPQPTAQLRAAARRLPSPFTTVYTTPGPGDAAFLCRGTACAPPARTPAELRAAYTALG